MSSFVAAEAGGFYFNFTRTSMFLQLYATVYITRIYSGEMKFITLKGGKKIFLLIPLQKPKKNIDICSCKFASSGLLLPAQWHFGRISLSHRGVEIMATELRYFYLWFPLLRKDIIKKGRRKTTSADKFRRCFFFKFPPTEGFAFTCSVLPVYGGPELQNTRNQRNILNIWHK